jgi:hypothetical protein
MQIGNQQVWHPADRNLPRSHHNHGLGVLNICWLRYELKRVAPLKAVESCLDLRIRYLDGCPVKYLRLLVHMTNSMNQEQARQLIAMDCGLWEQLKRVPMAASLRASKLLPWARLLPFEPQALHVALIIRPARIHCALRKQREQLACSISSLQIIETQKWAEILYAKSIPNIAKMILAPVERNESNWLYRAVYRMLPCYD